MNLRYFFKVTLVQGLAWYGFLVPWILAGVAFIFVIILTIKPPRKLVKFRPLFGVIAIVMVIVSLWLWWPKWQFNSDTSIDIPKHYSEQESKEFLTRRDDVLRDKESWGKNNAGLYNNIGIIRSGMGEYSGAVSSFKKAIKKNPNDPRFWRNLAIAYTSLDEYDEAEKAFKDVFKLVPTQAEYWLELGELYTFKLNDKTKARTFYLEAMNRSNGNINVARAFANFLENVEKDYTESIKYWQLVADAAPENNRLPFLTHIQQLKQQQGIK